VARAQDDHVDCGLRKGWIMTRNFMTLLFALTLLYAGPAQARRDDRGEAPRRRPEARAQRRREAWPLDQIDLRRVLAQVRITDQQEQRLKEAMAELRERMERQRAEIHERIQVLRDQLNEAIERGDEKAAQNRLEQIWQLRKRLTAERREGLMHILAEVLTDEQLAHAELILHPRKPSRLSKVLQALRTIPLNEDEQEKLERLFEQTIDRIEASLIPEHRKMLTQRLSAARRPERPGPRMRREHREARNRHERDER